MTGSNWLTGEAVELGRHTVTRDEILAFATAYDPQPFHIDDAAAAATPFGALCASGWHTAALWMRYHVLWAQQAFPENGGNAGVSPGIRDLKWLRPVYAGDDLRFFSRVTESRAVAERPEHRLLKSDNWGDNQHGDRVLEFTSAVFITDPQE